MQEAGLRLGLGLAWAETGVRVAEAAADNAQAVLGEKAEAAALAAEAGELLWI